jgi:site-specific DNA-cytosine methylase
VSQPLPTIATSGAIAMCSASGSEIGGAEGDIIDLDAPDAKKLLTQQVLHLAGNPGKGKPMVRFKNEVTQLDFFHRMLEVMELAKAQSFPADYQFAGGKTDAIWLIGNSVPPLMARALLKAHWTQNADVRFPAAAECMAGAA